MFFFCGSPTSRQPDLRVCHRLHLCSGLGKDQRSLTSTSQGLETGLDFIAYNNKINGQVTEFDLKPERVRYSSSAMSAYLFWIIATVGKCQMKLLMMKSEFHGILQKPP